MAYGPTPSQLDLDVAHLEMKLDETLGRLDQLGDLHEIVVGNGVLGVRRHYALSLAA
jgi:hypothetical protein